MESLKKHHFNTRDLLVGIAASGTTPYAVSTIEKARKEEAITDCITMNPGIPLEKVAEYPITVIVGLYF